MATVPRRNLGGVIRRSRRPAAPADPVQEWARPPAGLVLGEDEVHVWRADLDLPERRLRDLAETLSREERRRAAAFVADADRRRFVARRGLLRATLARYVGGEPDALEFSRDPNGKPELPGTGLRFSSSHSQGLALFACARQRRIGVDLEAVRPVPEVAQIARDHFSPRENAVLVALTAEGRLAAFFDGWTCKEAYAKATGEGLSRPFAAIDVALVPDEPAALLALDGAPEAAGRWSLRRLAPRPGYVAALAVEGHGVELSCWTVRGPRRFLPT